MINIGKTPGSPLTTNVGVLDFTFSIIVIDVSVRVCMYVHVCVSVRVCMNLHVYVCVCFKLLPKRLFLAEFSFVHAHAPAHDIDSPATHLAMYR